MTSVYDPAQLAAGWQSMTMLASLVQRGGHPAAVKPTISLRTGEEQFASFLADVRSYHSASVDLASNIGGMFRATATTGQDGWQPLGRQPVVLTTKRLVLTTEYEFRSLIMMQPHLPEYAVTLFFQGHEPIRLAGPWVPWMTVAVSAELFGTAWPPGHEPYPDVELPAQRRTAVAPRA